MVSFDIPSFLIVESNSADLEDAFPVDSFPPATVERTIIHTGMKHMMLIDSDPMVQSFWSERPVGEE